MRKGALTQGAMVFQDVLGLVFFSLTLKDHDPFVSSLSLISTKDDELFHS